MRDGDIDWSAVKRVLVVRLRSIGDTVLTTPSLIALRRALPDAQIDVLLEPWIAPLLEGFDVVDNVLTVHDGLVGRLRTAWELRGRDYDAVLNLHGGTTATMLTAATRARYRVGYQAYQYAFLHTHRYPAAIDYWNIPVPHSAEQQLALLGFAGINVQDRPKSRLIVTEHASAAIDDRLQNIHLPIALLHPAAAFQTKQWPTANFARTAEFLADRGVHSVAIASKPESEVLEMLERESKVPISTFDDLSLPEITALAAKAKLFVGNDSGIAHIAAAVNAPAVVIFGSSNRGHWRPWTDAPHETVFNELPCQPCPGYVCEVFGEPRCIRSIETNQVFVAIDRLLQKTKFVHEYGITSQIDTDKRR
jgi:lipopolysaccharide heptosyltransferase II